MCRSRSHQHGRESRVAPALGRANDRVKRAHIGESRARQSGKLGLDPGGNQVLAERHELMVAIGSNEDAAQCGVDPLARLRINIGADVHVPVGLWRDARALDPTIAADEAALIEQSQIGGAHECRSVRIEAKAITLVAGCSTTTRICMRRMRIKKLQLTVALIPGRDGLEREPRR